MVGLIILPCLFFPQVVFLGRMFLFTEPMAHDIPWQNLPPRCLLERSLKQETFPVWSKEVYCGFPFHAEGQGSFTHPLTLLTSILFPSSTALNLVILLSFLASGLLTLLFARQLGLSWSASFLAALAFSYSGYNIQKIHQVNILLTMCWLSLIFYGWEKYFHEGKMIAVMWAGLGWALQILAGNPGYAYYSFWAVLAFAVYGLFSETSFGSRFDRSVLARWALALLVFCLIGIGLSAVQWLPTWELVRRSMRSEGLSYEVATHFHYFWKDLLAWLHPLFLGDSYHEVKAFDRCIEIAENTSYVGIIPLGLALFGAGDVMRRPGRHRFFAGLLCACLALVLETPLYKVFWLLLPGFRFFRVPARWLFPAIFSAAMLAGMGLNRLQLRWAGRPYGQSIVVVLLILSLLDLWSYGHSHYETIDPHVWFKPPWAAEFLKSPRVRYGSYGAEYVLADTERELIASGRYKGKSRLMPYLIFKELLGPGSDLTWGLPGSWSNMTPIPLRRLNVLQEYSALGKVDGKIVLSSLAARLIRLQSVGFLLAPVVISGSDCEVVASSRPVVGGPTLYLHQMKDPLPRAFVVGRRLMAASPQDLLRILASKEFDPSHMVVVEQDSPQGENEAYGSIVKWEKDEPQQTDFKVEMKGNGYLVFCDSFYPGWTAEVDNEPAGIG